MQTYKKIYFSINGIGYGHASRTNKLIKYFLKRNFQVYVSTQNEGFIYLNNYYKNLFKTKGYNYIFEEKGHLSFKYSIARNLFKYIIIFFLHIFIETRNLFVIKPNIVISDSRVSTLLASFLLGIKSIVIVNQLYVEIPRIRPMTKLSRFLKRFSERVFYELWLWACKKASIILIPDLKPPYSISSKNILLKSKKDMEKIKFINLFFENESFEKENFIKKEKKIVSILLSGTIQERYILIKKFLEIIRENKKENLYFKILSGLNNIKYLKGDGYEIFPWIKNHKEISDILRDSDLLVLTGGHSSLLSALSYQKPILIVVPRAHTEKTKNAIKLKELGYAEYIFADEINKDNFLNLLENIFKKDLYRKNIIEENFKQNLDKELENLLSQLT